MAVLDFEIEFKMRSSVRMAVPDALKDMPENDLRRLLMECKYGIIKSINIKDCSVVRESPKITKKPEFVNGPEKDTKIGLSKLPTVIFGVHPCSDLNDYDYTETFKFDGEHPERSLKTNIKGEVKE